MPVFEGHHKANQLGTYYYHSTLHLMRGLIREQLGDRTGADEAFRNGTRSAYRETLPPEERAWRIDSDSNTIRDNLFMAARTGLLTDAEAIEERERIVALFSGSQNLGAIGSLLPVPPEALRKMWLLPSGRDLMRKIMFREADYAEVTWGPVKQLMVAVWHVDAVAELTPEHERILQKLADRFVEMIQQRKLGRAGLAKCANMWIGGLGAIGSFGWGGLKPLVPKDTVGSVAYVLGHRYVRLNRGMDAMQFFQTAVDSEEEGSTVRRLAQRELQRLKEKNK